jgi:poly-gamma-glutamate synthesis protein (capsule biosynthesis protein)
MSKISKILIIALIIALGGVLIYFVITFDEKPKPKVEAAKSSLSQAQSTLNTTQKDQNKPANQIQTEVKPPQIEPKLSSHLLFMGDVFWGRSINKWSQDSDLKYAYPFSGLSTFDRSKYNAWIANLECPITTQIRTPAQQEAGLKFTCLPDYLPEAKKYFDVFSQANNHTDNMQEFNGLSTTRKFLDEAGIQHFGSFDNRQTQDICEVVSLDAKQTDANNQTTTVKFPVAMCGYNNVFSLPSKASLEVISNYSKYFPTIIMPHQGQEYVNIADKYKVSTYRQMVDNGADLVVGAHPHVVQNTEVYKGKLIAYSLGNFIFDQQGGKNVTHHTALDVTIDFKDTDSENTKKWLELAKNCQNYKDDCLAQAQKTNLSKPEFNLTYDIIASQNEKKVTQKADDKIQAEILKLTNWDKTLKDLGQK